MQCHYHSGYQLSNMCVLPECAVPLCPKCINIHLTQSKANHQILPLDDAVQLTQSQLSLALESLDTVSQQISNKYSPDSAIKDYEILIKKYKDQAIQRINRHFNDILTTIKKQLTVVYNSTLLPCISPLKDEIIAVQKIINSFKDGSLIPATIRAIDSEKVKHVGQLMQKITSHKVSYQKQMPKLVGAEGGLLRVISQLGCDSSDLQGFKKKEEFGQNKLVATQFIDSELGGLEKIAHLQKLLTQIRYT